MESTGWIITFPFHAPENLTVSSKKLFHLAIQPPTARLISGSIIKELSLPLQNLYLLVAMMMPQKKTLSEPTQVIIYLIVLLGFISGLWFLYQQSLLQNELLIELGTIQDRKVEYLILRKGNPPFSKRPCLLITKAKDIKLVMDSLKSVSTEYGEPTKNPKKLRFQILINFKEGPPLDLFGVVYQPYPNDAFIEKNYWKKKKDGSHGDTGQRALYWPGIGPWLTNKAKEVDHDCKINESFELSRNSNFRK